MSQSVCLAPTRTLLYPDSGDHLWAYLNWVLGLQAIGCRVIWLEWIRPADPLAHLQPSVRLLKERLAGLGLDAHIALVAGRGTRLPWAVAGGCLNIEAATDAQKVVSGVPERALA